MASQTTIEASMSRDWGSSRKRQGCSLNTSGIMSASYTEASRTMDRDCAKHDASYLCGNHDSERFFNKMRDSHDEAERLRQQCRQASDSSEARQAPQKVSLSFVQKSIEAARAVSSFARDSAKQEPTKLAETIKPNEYHGVRCNCCRRVAGDVAGPVWLGHLAVPKADDQGGRPEEMGIPGAIDFDDACDAGSPGAGQQSPGSDKSRRGSARGHGQVADGSFKPTELRAIGDDVIREEAENAPRSVESSPFDGSNSPGREQDEEDDEGSMGSTEQSSEDYGFSKWQARPPVLRFKTRIQFSSQFKPSQVKELFEQVNEDLDMKCDFKTDEMKDPIIGWLNLVFAMNVETEYHFGVGFPIILLTMLDAIYPKRVRWHEVDWRFQYKRALHRNFSVLESIWAEVNMEKSREFRYERTSLRLDQMSTTTIKERLEFIRLMKRWFDQRIHHAQPYDPIQKRRDFVEHCRIRGIPVKFPPWMKYSEEPATREILDLHETQRLRQQEAFNAMPEYKRLINFLGSPDHQTM